MSLKGHPLKYRWWGVAEMHAEGNRGKNRKKK